MKNAIYSSLQIREIFHLEFLRWFSRKVEAQYYVLKGGVNLRLFFQSIRYSEDMDIDLQGIRVEKVKKIVMEILSARGFSDSLKSFGIESVVPPNMDKAKQTPTTQRFKIHLLTSGGEDLFITLKFQKRNFNSPLLSGESKRGGQDRHKNFNVTPMLSFALQNYGARREDSARAKASAYLAKIEFSRRGMKGSALVEPVSTQIARFYKMAPLLVSHYNPASAIAQKIQALALRSVLQARDIFDLFVLSSQYEVSERKNMGLDKTIIKTARDHIFLVEFPQFRDTVVAYLGLEDQKAYSSPGVWDEIKLKTIHFLEEF